MGSTAFAEPINEQGNPLPQSSLNSLYIQKQLPSIYEARLAELKAIKGLVYPK